MTDLERIAEQRALQSLYDLAEACRLAQDEWLVDIKSGRTKQQQKRKATHAKVFLEQYCNEVNTYLRNNR